MARTTVHPEFVTFKSDIDDWIKSFNSDLGKIRHVPRMMREVGENVDHNYELILELRKEIGTLREELQALRMVQLLHLKKELKRV